jgi:hypothetical protein
MKIYLLSERGICSTSLKLAVLITTSFLLKNLFYILGQHFASIFFVIDLIWILYIYLFAQNLSNHTNISIFILFHHLNSSLELSNQFTHWIKQILKFLNLLLQEWNHQRDLPNIFFHFHIMGTFKDISFYHYYHFH